MNIIKQITKMEYKKNDKVWVTFAGSSVPGVIKSESETRPSVEVTYNDALRKKPTKMTMGFTIDKISLRT